MSANAHSMINHLPSYNSNMSSRLTMYPLVVFLLFFFFLFLGCDAGGELNEEVLGLVVFKSHLHDPHSRLSSWTEDADVPCNFTGVSCDPRTGRVVELSLTGLSISGDLSFTGLLRLQSLRRLSLSSNNLTGEINSDLLRLQSLKILDLSSNRLSGAIPADFFAQCRSLRAISLADNEISGEIPQNVGVCSTLATLNLSGNQLSGSLPDGLWSLNALRCLDLSYNSLTGAIPNGINKMYNLRTINLRFNKLSGSLPADVGECLLLKAIDFSVNLLSGYFPDTIQKLSLCSSLSLSSNSFSGEIPAWIGEMRRLQTLDLSSNGFYGNIPESIGKLRLLREVNFSNNELNGSLASWVLGSDHLQRISMAGNKFSGVLQIPAATGIPSLQILDLSRNNFSGEVPTEISSIKSLKVLNLSSNSFSGALPASIGELKLLEELRLESNSLTGSIPDEIGNCTSLTALDLSNNNLTGSIPSTIANLTDLQKVDLSFNNLSGQLPSRLSDLRHLLLFNISHNTFSGDLPGGGFFASIPLSSLADNPDLCGNPLNRSCHGGVLPKPIVLDPTSPSSTASADPALVPGDLRHKKIILSISTLVAIAAAAVIAVGVITITVLNVHVRSSSASPSGDAAALELSDSYFSHSPTATDVHSGKLFMFTGSEPEFSAGTHAVLNKDCELGRGGFGAVYKTILADGRPVAIKKLTVSSTVKSQEEFETEVKRLGKMKHPNLVLLEGYYWTSSLQLLIYEYVSGGNLYKHLHENSSSSILSWRERFDIILGTARSLAYLHDHKIIHYNVKSSNVLINDNGEPKLGDYGLAKLLPMLDRYVLSSKIQSALGYMAPEFACKSVKINDKCDVYGFGVLMLEILTGRKPVEYVEDDIVVLCDVVRNGMERGMVEEYMDSRLRGEFPAEEAVPVIKLGLICTSQVPSSRPSMAEVVNILEVIKSPAGNYQEEFS